MKKEVIAFSSLVFVAASFPAAAQAPAWFSIKHPEIKVMERMRAEQSAPRAGGLPPVAAHASAAGSAVPDSSADWYAVKHPEIKVMERMRAEEEARDRARLALHHAGSHEHDRDSGGEPHRS